MNTIRTRLLAVFLLIASLPLLTIALVGYSIFDDALRQQAIANLRVVANAKARQIEDYALERKRDVATLAGTPAMEGLIGQFTSATSSGGLDGPALAAATAAARQYSDYYVREGAYTDLLLFDAAGRLLFSAVQTEAIGQNFLAPERASTAIGEVYDRARTLLETEISDFSANGTAYIAAPVLRESTIIGAVALQISSRQLFAVVGNAIGLQQSGETVVGTTATLPDGPGVRVTAPLRLSDDRSLVLTPLPAARFPLLASAVEGTHTEGQGEDYRNVDVVYVLRYLPSLRWGMVVKTDSAEAFASIDNVRNLVVALLAFTLGVVALVAIGISQGLTKPIVRLTETVRAFERGDLAVRAPVFKTGAEVDDLSRGFNDLAEQLSSTINSLESRVADRTRALEQQAVQLSEARALSDRANQSKSIFLANMSHELRTPMNAILGFTQLIAREPSLEPRLRDYLDVVQRSGDHLLSLINDVLEMSRIEAGQTAVNAAAFDLYAMLKNVEDLFHLRTEEKGLRLLIEHAEDVPQFITTDESKLRQILINLIGNAVKFTHEGGIAMRAGLRGGKLLFEVEDTGDGISEEDQKRLFHAFVQTETGVKSQQGSGLGLAITRQFIELLGGQVSLRSQVGHGTVFTFDVAFEPADAVVAENRPRPRVIGIQEPAGNAWRVLVADDKWENRRLMIEWMKIAGFEVREASNGKEAVEMWSEWEPHLIWMDMRMPVMDGYEATRTIKSSTKGQATVIIALTASAFEHERAIVLSAGCDDFVRKPARESLIFDKMVEHLGITFRYAEQEVQPGQANAPAPLTTARLGALSPDQRERLAAAADEVDPEAAALLIAELRSTHPDIADRLADLVNHYRFDQIQTLLEETP